MSLEAIYQIVYALISMVGGLIVYQTIFFFLKRWAKNKRRIPTLLNKYIYYPGLYMMSSIAASVGLTFIRKYLSIKLYDILSHTLHILIIAFVGLLLTRIVKLFRDLGVNHYKVENPLDYSWRKAKTKFQLIQRMLNLLIVIATIAIILMTFDSIRQIGSTILASAGVLGLVLGFAAQKSLGTLFAGIQIAITQPIRIDDIVVVEGLSGTISEITLTYVIVRVWDGRRLTIPVNYFLEKSFENLTRDSPEMIAKVTIFMDYSLPVDEVRQQFFKWLDESPLWDRRKRSFSIIGADDKTIQIRGTMSVKNDSDGGDLEVMIRERLITYVQQNYPDSLPKMRYTEKRLPDENA